MISNELTLLINTLHKEKCSCVIQNGERVILCHQRGVKDLFDLLMNDKNLLEGAIIADKVVGKGAAALMIKGAVKEVYADIISEPALSLFKSVGMPVDYKECVPNIINRTHTGICPVESLCANCATASECIPLIEKFIFSIAK